VFRNSACDTIKENSRDANHYFFVIMINAFGALIVQLHLSNPALR